MDVAGAAAGAVLASFVNKWMLTVPTLTTSIYTSGSFTVTYSMVASFAIAIALVVFGRKFKILQWVGIGWLLSNITQLILYFNVGS
jgi:hypothetical protein